MDHQCHVRFRCLVCQKEGSQDHHIIKRRRDTLRLTIPSGLVIPSGLTIPLCPSHHKLADLGKIEISKLLDLRRLDRVIDEILKEEIDLILCKQIEKKSWETEYFFQVGMDYYGREGLGYGFDPLGFLDFPENKRSETVSLWLWWGRSSAYISLKMKHFPF